jgi:hypothetical protein
MPALRLHSSVTACYALGWSSTAIGVIAVAVSVAQSHSAGWQLGLSLALAAFIVAWMWVLVTRRRLLGTPTRPPAEWSIEPAAAMYAG